MPKRPSIGTRQSSAVVYAFGYLKALTTGKPAKAGDVGTVDLR